MSFPKELLPLELKGGPQIGHLYWADGRFMMAGPFDLMSTIKEAIEAYNTHSTALANVTKSYESLQGEHQLLIGTQQKLQLSYDAQLLELTRLKQFETALNNLGLTILSHANAT